MPEPNGAARHASSRRKFRLRLAVVANSEPVAEKSAKTVPRCDRRGRVTFTARKPRGRRCSGRGTTADGAGDRSAERPARDNTRPRDRFAFRPMAGPCRIVDGRLFVVMLVEPVGAPFPAVAVHVVQSKGVGLELADRRGPGRSHRCPTETGTEWSCRSSCRRRRTWESSRCRPGIATCGFDRPRWRAGPALADRCQRSSGYWSRRGRRIPIRPRSAGDSFALFSLSHLTKGVGVVPRDEDRRVVHFDFPARRPGAMKRLG